MKYWLKFITVLGLFAIISTTVYAQENNKNYRGIIINPAIIYIELNPGKTYTGEIKLTHDFQNKDNYTFYPTSRNFRQQGETGKPEFYIDDNVPYNANPSKWITFQEDSYTLNYQESVMSHFSITAPTDAETGGYYVGIIYPEDISKVNAEHVALGEEIGTLIFITVNGDINENGELVEFYVDQDFNYSDNTYNREEHQGFWEKHNIFKYTPLQFHIRYKNTGNIHTQIGGNIFIYKKDVTNPLAIIKVNDDVHYALPDSVRNYVEPFDYGFIVYNNNGKLEFATDQFPKLMIGKYTARLMLKHTVNNERITTMQELTFWMLPIEVLIVIISVFIILAVVIYLKLKTKDSTRKKK